MDPGVERSPRIVLVIVIELFPLLGRSASLATDVNEGNDSQGFRANSPQKTVEERAR
jgi:hypothetical protein